MSSSPAPSDRHAHVAASIDLTRLREFLSRPTLAPKLRAEHLATVDRLEHAVSTAERLIEHWSTHQLHSDWVYERSREWLRLYGKKES